jgi:translation initiation factor IF-3
MLRLAVVVQGLARAASPAKRYGHVQLHAIAPPIARQFTTTPPRHAPRTPVKIVTIEDKLREFNLDENIETPEVRVRGKDGVSEPQDLLKLIDSIDRTTQHVVQVSKPGEHEVAIVTIRNRADLIKQIKVKEEQARKQQKTLKDQKPKQIELNWAIGPNDLQLKLKQMTEFLKKGKKVEFLLAAKRRQRKATPEEAQALIKAIKDKMVEVGAKEVKPLDGQLLKTATWMIGG